MSVHILLRNGSTDQGTFGELIIRNKKFYTVERPWADNKPNVSCVPIGTYQLVDHSSQAHPNTFALVNEEMGVYHFKHEMKKSGDRWGIVIHVANTIDDIEGCIGVGYNYGVVYTRWAVKQSRDATAEAVGMMKDGDSLRIIENKWGW